MSLATGASMIGCGVSKAGELAIVDEAGVDTSNFSKGDASAGGSGAGSGFGALGDDDSGSGSSGSSNSGSSSGSGSGSHSGTPFGGDPDAGFIAGGCDFDGTWATKLTIGVDWVPQGLMGVILAPGRGLIQQWVLSTRVQNGTKVTDTAVVCGISLPDFSGTPVVGGETYGVRFPDSLFDKNHLSPFTIDGTLSDSSPHAKYSSPATAVLLGMTLNSPATAPWPATVTTAVDSDMDMNPGVTVNAATGPLPNDAGTYQTFPVDPFGSRADQLYVVIRQVTALSGAASDCDHLSGTVNIPKITPAPSSANASNGPKYAIDSHVIGCHLTTDTMCSSSQIGFIDGTQPVFSPDSSQVAAFATIRVKSTADCPSVREALP
jgi:hypothetical protein